MTEWMFFNSFHSIIFIFEQPQNINRITLKDVSLKIVLQIIKKGFIK